MAIKGGALLAAAVLCLVPMSTAHAQLTPEPIQGFFGNENVTPNLVVGKGPAPSATNALTVIYDNTASAPNFGFSSSDLTSQFGDELFTTGTGMLSSQKFTLFNGAATGAGPLLTAVVGIQIFDAVTAASLGSYSVSVNFGAGLNPGFFSIITVTNLDPLVILLPTTDIVVIQRVISFTGTPLRLGIASLNPPTVGGSPNTMYISSSTVGGGIPGFYTIATGPANPGYQLGAVPPPVPTVGKSWSQLKKLYR